jgi:hypothetical protein
VSGFLHRLVARTIGQANIVRPRLAPRFAGTPDLPVDSPYVDSPYVDSGHIDSSRVDSSRAAPAAGRPTAEPVDGTTIPQSDTYAERERAAREVFPAIEGLPDHMPVEHPSPAACGEKHEANNVTVRDIGISTRHDDAPAPRVSTHEDTAQGPPEANRIAARDRRADPAPTAEAIERRAPTDEARVADAARNRRPRIFDPDGFGVMLPRETIEPPPLAPMLAGPRTGARESEATASHATPDRARFEAAPEPEATIVNVSIGRIEVRSPAEPPMRAFRREAPAAPQPRDQLDTYLRARSGSKR